MAPDGSRDRVTLFEKRRREANDDVKKQLALASYLILDRDEKEIKQSGELKGRRTLLDKLAEAGSMGGSTKSQSKKSKKQGVFSDEDFV